MEKINLNVNNPQMHQVFGHNTTAKNLIIVRQAISIFAPVKFLGYIMAILVLALSCLPCADGPSMSDNAKTDLIAMSDQQEDDHEDSCSPFCQCACCAGLSISHSIAGITYEIHYYDKTYTSFGRCEIAEISLPIWQPPQLS